MGSTMDAAQIRDRLLAEILDGDPDSRVSFDEYSTVRRLGVPRSALRDALSSLTDAGILTRAPRVGTSLATSMHHWSVENTALEPVARGTRYETLGIEVLVPHEDLSVELTGEPGSRLTRVERVSRLDGVAAEHWTIWTTLELPDEYHRKGLPADMNWYKVVGALTSAGTLQMTRRTIDCRATAADREHLDVEVGDPLRFTSRTLSLPDGTRLDRGWGRVNSRMIIPTERFTIRL